MTATLAVEGRTADRYRCLPAEPFLRLVDGWGGPRELGVRQHSAEERAIERARQTGVLTLGAADRLAVHVLRLSACEVWGAAFYDA